MDKYESQHNKTMEHYAMLIQQLFGIALNDFIQAATLASDDYSGNEIFNFDNYPITRAAVQNIVNTLASDVNATVINGCKAVWDISNKKNNALVDELFKGKTLTDEQKIRYFQNNEPALKAFTERKHNGLRLSDRVWNIVGGYKYDIENALSVSIEKGQSAHALAKEVQQYLNEPNKLFRRVRDEFGELQLSQNAKNYHPGQGVYRSSYKNAMRLARTEINMAYHTADNTRWQQFDFIVGIEIKTSHNHPEKDVCDQLAGRYPKDFKFVGWHPHCRCYQKSILKTEEEMDKDADRMRQHEEPTANSVNSVSDVPDGFKGWITENEEKIKRAKSKPYFVTDNKRFVDEILSPAPKKPTIAEIAEARHKARTPEQIDEIQAAWNERKQLNIIHNQHPDITQNLSTTQQEKWIETNKKISALLNVEQGVPMTFEQADEMRGNPNFVAGSGSGYTINCASSVFANELRRRGFDVEAMMNTRQNSNAAYQLSKQTELAWIDPATGRPPIPSKISYIPTQGNDWNIFQSIERDFRAELEKQGKLDKFVHVNTPDEAIYLPNGRYHLRMKWGDGFGGGGHIVTFEKIGIGQYRFLDPQTGKTDNLSRLLKGDMTVEYYRVDNLMPNPDYIGAVAKQGTTKPSKIKYAKKRGGWSGAMNSENNSNWSNIEHDKNYKPIKNEKNIYAPVGESAESDYNDKLSTARIAVEHGYRVWILGKTGKRNPDYIFERKGVYKVFDLKRVQSIDSLMQDLIKSEGQTDRVIVKMNNNGNTRIIINAIKKYFEKVSDAKEVMIFKGKRKISVERNFFEKSNYYQRFFKIWR